MSDASAPLMRQYNMDRGFVIDSPPSGCEGGFRPRAAEHARRTKKGRSVPAPASIRLVLLESYLVRCISEPSPEIAACAAANLAIGTRYGEHET